MSPSDMEIVLHELSIISPKNAARYKVKYILLKRMRNAKIILTSDSDLLHENFGQSS
jgi:hypothetical protein